MYSVGGSRQKVGRLRVDNNVTPLFKNYVISARKTAIDGQFGWVAPVEKYRGAQGCSSGSEIRCRVQEQK